MIVNPTPPPESFSASRPLSSLDQNNEITATTNNNTAAAAKNTNRVLAASNQSPAPLYKTLTPPEISSFSPPEVADYLQKWLNPDIIKVNPAQESKITLSINPDYLDRHGYVNLLDKLKILGKNLEHLQNKVRDTDEDHQYAWLLDLNNIKISTQTTSQFDITPEIKFIKFPPNILSLDLKQEGEILPVLVGAPTLAGVNKNHYQGLTHDGKNIPSKTLEQLAMSDPKTMNPFFELLTIGRVCLLPNGKFYMFEESTPYGSRDKKKYLGLQLYEPYFKLKDNHPFIQSRSFQPLQGLYRIDTKLPPESLQNNHPLNARFIENMIQATQPSLASIDGKDAIETYRLNNMQPLSNEYNKYLALVLGTFCFLNNTKILSPTGNPNDYLITMLNTIK